MLNEVSFNGRAATAPQNPITEAKTIISELNLLLKDPVKNQTEIEALQEQLRDLVMRNPGSFSDIEKNDVYQFCNLIEFSYTHSLLYLGMAEGYFTNLQLDFSQKTFPIIPSISQQFFEDIFEIDSELSEEYPDTQKIALLLADVKKSMPSDLPLLVKEKIQAAMTRITQYLQSPTDQLKEGIAFGDVESVLYILWKLAPLPPTCA